MDERTAVMSCSGAANRLGEIVEVNMPIIKMFGYARSELVVVNIARLMPDIYGYVCSVNMLFNHLRVVTNSTFDCSTLYACLLYNLYIISFVLLFHFEHPSFRQMLLT